VFKRLADDHVLGVGSTVPAPEAGQPASRSPFGDVAENPTKAVAAIEQVASSDTAEIDDSVAPNDALSRLQVDAMAAQFAAF
jgi:ABC-type xylose transport system substrate-binding protein